MYASLAPFRLFWIEICIISHFRSTTDRRCSVNCRDQICFYFRSLIGKSIMTIGVSSLRHRKFCKNWKFASSIGDGSKRISDISIRIALSNCDDRQKSRWTLPKCIMRVSVDVDRLPNVFVFLFRFDISHNVRHDWHNRWWWHDAEEHTRWPMRRGLNDTSTKWMTPYRG